MDERIGYFLLYATVLAVAILLGRYLHRATAKHTTRRRWMQALVYPLCGVLAVTVIALAIDATRPGPDVHRVLINVAVTGTIIAALLLPIVMLWAGVVAYRRRELVAFVMRCVGDSVYFVGTAVSELLRLLVAAAGLLAYSLGRPSKHEEPIVKAGLTDHMGRRPMTPHGINEVETDPYALDTTPGRVSSCFSFPEDDAHR